MPDLRVLERITRQMQRLGYLKHLLKRVAATETNNVDNLGHSFIETVTHKVQVSLDENLVKYIKLRLYDRTYDSIKKQADIWTKTSTNITPPIIPMEIQDLYLADPLLPSGVGKLVKNDWDVYPAFGVSLGFIRAGTYSANTRTLSLLHFTSESEQAAFQNFDSDVNPLSLSKKQTIIFLFSFIEHDGEVVLPLWRNLPKDSYFNDRDAGDLIPEIYKDIISRHRKRMLSVEIRERLASLEKSSESIAKQRGKTRYAGGSSREHASRPRLEPYVDIGVFTKRERLRYEYKFSQFGRSWIKALDGISSNREIGDFLSNSFFTTFSNAWEISARKAITTEEIIPHLSRAWKLIASPGGYAPIEEMALVVGIDGLLDHNIIIEPAIAREAIIAYQKENPYKVRFTVNRMGVLAHARFLEEPG